MTVAQGIHVLERTLDANLATNVAHAYVRKINALKVIRKARHQRELVPNTRQRRLGCRTAIKLKSIYVIRLHKYVPMGSALIIVRVIVIPHMAPRTNVLKNQSAVLLVVYNLPVSEPVLRIGIAHRMSEEPCKVVEL